MKKKKNLVKEKVSLSGIVLIAGCLLITTAMNAQQVTQYTYDANGNRVSKTAEATVVKLDSGTDYTAWVYNLPKRTRTATPWTQEVYSNGNRSPKAYGTPYGEEETGKQSEKISDWNYTQLEATGNRTRTRQPIYTFTDIVKEGTATTETHTATSRTENFKYNYSAQSRTGSILFKFQDNTTYTLDKGTEKGAIKILFSATPSTRSIVAGGGTVTITATDPHITWNGTRVVHLVTLSNSKLLTVTAGEGFTVGTNTVTAANRGTIVGNTRSCVVKLQASATIDGVTTSGIDSYTTTIEQYYNSVSSTGNDIVANPSSVTLSRNAGIQTIPISGSATVRYTSGASKQIYLNSSNMKATPSASWIQISYIGSANCTFSLNNPSAGATGYIEMTHPYDGGTLSGRINITITN
ncbi:MAG: hypothetical protein LUH10_10900 [Tannerellaceae bacterium]|nr:hypothetical protein [Tannerellaceae bacterium]